MESIAAVVIGFVLTTVAGGWWAARLQERAWLRQNEVRLQEAEQRQAGAACEEIASLLDRRLYRMHRLVTALSTENGPLDLGEVERRRQQYVEVLFAWNDRLNANLSMIGTYFGDPSRILLDGLYEDFARVGRDIDAGVRAALAGDALPETVGRAAAEFEGRRPGSLNDRVYRFGLQLTGQLRDGRVGRHAPIGAVSRTKE